LREKLNGEDKMEKTNRELIEDFDYKFTNIYGENWYIKKKSEFTFLITSDDKRIFTKIKEMPINPQLLKIEEIVDQADFKAVYRGITEYSGDLKDLIPDEVKTKEYFHVPWIMSDVEKKWLNDCMEAMRNPDYKIEKNRDWKCYER
jgi:hypothetical protein